MAGLGPYVVKRLVQALITLFVVTSIIWVLFEAMPGDPTDPFYGNPNFKADQVADMAVKYGLADKYVEHLGAGDFTQVNPSEIPNAPSNATFYLKIFDFPKKPRAITFNFNSTQFTLKLYVFSNGEKIPLSQIWLENESATVPENYTYKWTLYNTLGRSIQSVGVLPEEYVYLLIEVAGQNTPLPQNLDVTTMYVIDTPLYVRYVTFLRNMFTFQFGWSIKMGQPVIDILKDRVPRTLLWFGLGTILVYLVGIPLGTYIAWKRGGPAEGAVVGFSLFFYNMPSFWLGLIFIWIFSYTLGWTPIGGFASQGYTGPGSTCAVLGVCPGNPFYVIVDYGWHLLLPLLVILLLGMAGIILLQRTSMLETMGEDYILTAKAKGLPEKVVRNKHARRNAMLPIVTAFVLSLSYSIGGAVILEQIFSYYGVGYTYLQALLQQDFFLAGAALFIISLLVIIGNIIADILYGFLDPRVRIQ